MLWPMHRRREFYSNQMQKVEISQIRDELNAREVSTRYKKKNIYS